MDREILKAHLNLLNINPNDYSIDGTLKPMRTTLLNSHNSWFTFEYDERGSVLDIKKFFNEGDACQDVIERLLYLKEWRKKYNVK